MQMQSKEGAPIICTSEIFPNDVLLGRGTGPNEHMGNCIFREEVEKCREAYLSASVNKAREEQILDGIVSSIQQRGGRFLRKLDSQSDTAGKTVYQVVIDKKVLAYKIKQAVRYSKRRDKKMEANSEWKKPEDVPNDIASLGESSHSTSAALLSRGRAAITMTNNPLSHAAAVKDPSPAAPLTEAERRIYLAQQSSLSPFELAAAHQTKDLPAISQSQLRHQTFSQGNISNTNYLRDPAANAISDEVLDHLALRYLQKVDPRASQLVLEQRRQKQQSLQLGNSRLQQPFGLSATEQQHRRSLEGKLEPQSFPPLSAFTRLSPPPQAQPERRFSSPGASSAQHDYTEQSYSTSSKDGKHSHKRQKTQH